MQLPGEHLPFSVLADLAEGWLSPTDDERAHLASCKRCANELAWLQKVVTFARGAVFEEPTAETVRQIKSLVATRRSPSGVGARLIHAISRFDSLQHTPALGRRSFPPHERQILLDAEATTIDLRITAAGEHWVVAGQLFFAPGDLVTASVELVGGEERADTRLNELCEFVLPPMRAGHYSLTVTLDDHMIVISGLELGD